MKSATDISQLRASLGMDRVNFALLLHVPQATIERWEAGLDRPTPGQVRAITEIVRSRARSQAPEHEQPLQT